MEKKQIILGMPNAQITLNPIGDVLEITVEDCDHDVAIVDLSFDEVVQLSAYLQGWVAEQEKER